MNFASLGVALVMPPIFLTLSACAEAEFDEANRAAVFAAAGFTLSGDEYIRCDDRITVSRQPGSIEMLDLNLDGRPEALVKESSLYCYGNTGEAFVLVGRQEDGSWRILLDEVGIPIVRESEHQGWPDIEVGGPFAAPYPNYHFDGRIYRRAP